MTDTTQANEDELRVKVYNEIKLWLSPHESLQFIDDFMPIMTSIVRTEKLKLLAEVRERVVGEDILAYDTPEITPHLLDLMECQNQLRVEQRAELTKLEAEL